MTRQLELVTPDSTTIDLLNGVAQAILHGWQTQSADFGEQVESTPFGATVTIGSAQPIVDTIPLILIGSQVEILAVNGAIERLLQALRAFTNERSGEQYALLRYRSAVQTKAQQAAIYDGALSYPSDGLVSLLAYDGPESEHQIDATLTLLRHPFPEDATEKTPVIRQENGVVVVEFPAGGTADGRVTHLQVSRNSTDGKMSGLFGGIRPKHAGFDAFRPIWNLYNAIPSTENIFAVENDAAAIGGNYLDVPHSATEISLYQYIIQLNSDTSVDHQHFHGDYNVLLRYRDGGARYRVTLGKRYLNRTFKLPPRYIGSDDGVANNDWQVVNMGRVSFPGIGGRLGSAAYRSQGLEIFIKWLNGTQNLWLDALILVPAARSLVLDGFHQDLANTVRYETDVQDRGRAWSGSDATNPHESMEEPVLIGGESFYVPSEGGVGVFIVLRDGDDTHIVHGDGLLDFTLGYVDRYQVLNDQ